MAKFEGFGPEALAFFKALDFHQTREWFQDNKPLYERAVREPMLALLDDLTTRFGRAGIPLRGDKDSIFRIHRDVRFAKDKRPYQTHIGAVLTRTGSRKDAGLLYIHIQPAGLVSFGEEGNGSFAAAGFHMSEPENLLALRNAIRATPEAWLKLEAQLARAGLRLNQGDAMKRLPAGFEAAKGTAIEPAILRRSLMAEIPLAEAAVTTPELADTIFDLGKKARPLLDFGWSALG